MKKVLSVLLSAIAITSCLFVTPAWAADLANGKTLFTEICVTCHVRGNNVVNPTKTLQKEDLKRHGKDSIDAIITQVTNGKNAMPAFGSLLTASEIEDVAAYVLDKAEQGWYQ